MPIPDKNIEVNLPNINIAEEMVRNEILKLNVNKSCKPDEIHPQILIELVDLVSKPLAVLLNETMDEGLEVYRRTGKIVYVSPIFKKVARNKAEKCRLISLTSTACKLMESFDNNPHESRKSFAIETVCFPNWKIHHDTIVILS